MEKLENYRALIKRILQHHALHKSSNKQIETLVICDEATDNYLLMDIGWHPNGRRLHSVPIHVRLCNGKFWIEWDGTEHGVAQELLDAGVPKEDIVLAFYHPKRREITEFAIA